LQRIPEDLADGAGRRVVLRYAPPLEDCQCESNCAGRLRIGPTPHILKSSGQNCGLLEQRSEENAGLCIAYVWSWPEVAEKPIRPTGHWSARLDPPYKCLMWLALDPLDQSSRKALRVASGQALGRQSRQVLRDVIELHGRRWGNSRCAWRETTRYGRSGASRLRARPTGVAAKERLEVRTCLVDQCFTAGFRLLAPPLQGELGKPRALDASSAGRVDGLGRQQQVFVGPEERTRRLHRVAVAVRNETPAQSVKPELQPLVQKAVEALRAVASWHRVCTPVPATRPDQLPQGLPRTDEPDVRNGVFVGVGEAHRQIIASKRPWALARKPSSARSDNGRGDTRTVGLASHADGGRPCLRSRCARSRFRGGQRQCHRSPHHRWRPGWTRRGTHPSVSERAPGRGVDTASQQAPVAPNRCSAQATRCAKYSLQRHPHTRIVRPPRYRNCTTNAARAQGDRTSGPSGPVGRRHRHPPFASSAAPFTPPAPPADPPPATSTAAARGRA